MFSFGGIRGWIYGVMALVCALQASQCRAETPTEDELALLLRSLPRLMALSKAKPTTEVTVPNASEPGRSITLNLESTVNSDVGVVSLLQQTERGRQLMDGALPALKSGDLEIRYVDTVPTSPGSLDANGAYEVVKGKRTIYIRSGLELGKQAAVLFHELYHSQDKVLQELGEKILAARREQQATFDEIYESASKRLGHAPRSAELTAEESKRFQEALDRTAAAEQRTAYVGETRAWKATAAFAEELMKAVPESRTYYLTRSLSADVTLDAITPDFIISKYELNREQLGDLNALDKIASSTGPDCRSKWAQLKGMVRAALIGR